MSGFMFYDDQVTDANDWKRRIIDSAPDAGLGRCVGDALEHLFMNDASLLERDAHERTITARLAYYLQSLFPDWNVDSEYNRDGHAIKRVDGVIVVPDIIVHRRGTPENLLVIEVKKSNTREPDERDIEKLTAFRTSDLAYRHGLFLKLIAQRLNSGVDRHLWV